MDGEAGWWTTSGNIGLPPLARVIGVGRQQQHHKMSSIDHLQTEAEMRKVREHSDLLSAQYLARCLEPGNLCHSITTGATPEIQMKETLYIRHRNKHPPISSSEKDLARKERSTLAHLRYGYCRLMGSYKSRIKKGAIFNVCVDCGTTPHDVKHLFVWPAHPTTMRPSDLCSRSTDAVRELNYLETRDPD